jgi:isoleucyl-tRNA synthetase
MVSEEIWRGLTGGRSVHLTDWPDPAALPADDALVGAMDRAREVASATLGLRKAQGLRVRQPLRGLSVVTADPAVLEPFVGVITDEVNVKQVRLVALHAEEAAEVGVSQRLTVNARAAGPRLGRQVQSVIRASKTGDWSLDDDGSVVCGGVPLVAGEFTVETVVAEADATSRAVAVLPSGGFVVLDTTVDDDLEAEGWARDVVRQVQDERKAAGLHVSDQIRLRLTVPVARTAAAQRHLDMVKSETLATSVEVVGIPDGDADGDGVVVAVEKV